MLVKSKKKKRNNKAGKYKDATTRQRDRRTSKPVNMRKTGVILLVCILLVLSLFTYVRKIVRLKSENHRLKQQEAQLEKERDRRANILEGIDDAGYMEEQARKQLKLMNPDEILFTYDNGEEEDGKNKD